MKTRNFDDFIRPDIERDMAYHERLQSKQQPPQKPPAPQPAAHFLSQVPDAPLTWLWPGHTPQAHLSLLDAVPGSGLSLLALTLAACVSSGSPLSDGTPTQQGHVILLAPYDSPTDLLKPRLQAAGDDPDHVLLVHPLVGDASPVPNVPGASNTSDVPSSQSSTLTNSLQNGVPNVSNVPNGAFPQNSLLANSPQSDVSSDAVVSIPDPPPGTPSSIPNVSSVPIVSFPSSQRPPLAHSSQSDAPPVTTIPITDPPSSTQPCVPSVPNVPSVPSSQYPPLAPSPQSDEEPLVPNVSSVPSVSNPAHSTSEVAQQPRETASTSHESAPQGHGTS